MVQYALNRLFGWNRIWNDRGGQIELFVYVDDRTYYRVIVDDATQKAIMDVEKQLTALLGASIEVTGKIDEKQTIQAVQQAAMLVDKWAPAPVLPDDEAKVASTKK